MLYFKFILLRFSNIIKGRDRMRLVYKINYFSSGVFFYVYSSFFNPSHVSTLTQIHTHRYTSTYKMTICQTLFIPDLNTLNSTI